MAKKHPSGNRSIRPQRQNPNKSAVQANDPIHPNQQSQLIAEQHFLEIRKGPLPSPKEMAEYDAVLPGLATRVVQMAELEQKNRHSLQHKFLSSKAWTARVGQWLGFTISMSAIAAGTYLTTQGHDTVGGVIFGTTVIGIAIVFVTGKRAKSSQNERDTEAEEEED